MNLTKIKPWIQRRLVKPEYIYHPTQIWKRLTHSAGGANSVIFPWHQRPFYFNPQETIGRSLRTMGVYDLVVTEAFHRIVKADSIVVDVGANIGYFSVLGSCLGAQVYAFEPHPTVYKALVDNSAGLSIEASQVALSEEKGTANLHIPLDFNKNEGLASLEPLSQKTRSIEIEKDQFDNLTEFSGKDIQLMKIDVEGHELSVLKGAENALESQRVKFVIFEDFQGPESSVISYLNHMKYRVYRLKKTLSGPELVTPEEGVKLPNWEPANYIASRSEVELMKLFAKKGWKTYRKWES